MHTYADDKKYEKAAVVRDKINDLQYISQKIDIDLGDTEREFKKIKQAKFIEGISEVITKLKIPYPEHKLDKFRSECYDISNISGEIAYGSMVVANGTEIDKSQYRIFKIKESEKPNDVGMLRETLTRRLKYLKHSGTDEKESLGKKPNLIVLDGGKAHLSSLAPMLTKLNIPAIAISKGKRLKKAGKRQTDEFWKIRPNGKVRKFSIRNPYIFQRLRDEAHRFAIKHHRKGRRANQKKSILDKITGVGPKRKKALIKEFKTVSKIKEADIKKINEIIKNQKVAERIKKVLSEKEN
jgi:excinuclease ABC subunit C